MHVGGSKSKCILGDSSDALRGLDTPRYQKKKKYIMLGDALKKTFCINGEIVAGELLSK